MKKTFLLRTLSLALATMFPGLNLLLADGFINPLRGGGDLDGVLNTVVDVVIFILIPIIILMLVYTGFLFVQAQGNPAKLSEAKKAFVWTLVGAFVILAARALKEAVVATVESL